MTIYRINSEDQMIESSRIQLDREVQLEDWLTNSPWAIAEESLLIIGRQTTARTGNEVRYPDLIALDQSGNVVIIELKKGRAPREVVAQTLEYASWASNLNETDIKLIAEDYLNEPLDVKFVDHFELEEVPSLGKELRLFIASEEIPESVLNTCRYLRMNHQMDISCVSYIVYQDSEEQILIDATVLVGNEPIRSRKNITALQKSQSNWNGDKPVKNIIVDTVNSISTNDKNFEFTPKDVIEEIKKSYPEVNKSTIRCQIASDCVNHASRHHWPGGIDRYWLVKKGVYRLYRKGSDPKC
jgi:hypothetical protein